MDIKDQNTRLTIRAWAEDDRPREKLMLKGRAALSDAELIAILIGSGNQEETAVELSKRILNSVNFKLKDLGKSSVSELIKFKGIGEAKAISIVAALELGRRRRDEEGMEKVKIGSSKDVFEHFHGTLGDLQHEEFWVLLLDRANKVIGRSKISQGGVSGTVADPKLIFKKAIEQLASGIILCHNHPSGNLKPSEADIKLTKKLKSAGDSLDIPVLDHLIVTDEGYFSFADESLL